MSRVLTNNTDSVLSVNYFGQNETLQPHSSREVGQDLYNKFVSIFPFTASAEPSVPNAFEPEPSVHVEEPVVEEVMEVESVLPEEVPVEEALGQEDYSEQEMTDDQPKVSLKRVGRQVKRIVTRRKK